MTLVVLPMAIAFCLLPRSAFLRLPNLTRPVLSAPLLAREARHLGLTIVGEFFNTTIGNFSGYIRSTNGFFSTVNFPTAFTRTEVFGINNKGQFVGFSSLCCTTMDL